MATNRFNTIITQVKGSTMVIEFSDQPSRPFKVAMPGQFHTDGYPRYIVFTSQTKARTWVMANDPAFTYLKMKTA
jgi:hypothetical protein